MPKRSKRSNNNRRRKSTAGRKQPGPANVRVSVLPPQVRDKTHLFTMRALHGNLTSSAGGIITNVITDNPSVANDWTNVAALFDSYRVKELTITFFPNFVGSTTVAGIVLFPPLYVVYDPDTSTAVATVGNALDYGNCKFQNLATQWTLTTQVPRVMSSGTGTTKILDGGFIDSAAPAGISSFSWYGDNFSVSTAYGSIVITLIVEARFRL